MAMFDGEGDGEDSPGVVFADDPSAPENAPAGDVPTNPPAAANDSTAQAAYASPVGAKAPVDGQPVDAVYGVPPSVPQMRPLAPLPDHSADAQALAQQKAYENPAAYKPSGWRRALAAIAGGMVAAGSRNPEAGMQWGQSVLDAPKQRMEAQWAQQEAPLVAKLQADSAGDQQIRDNNAAILQQNNENQRQFRNQAYVSSQAARAQAAQAQAQQKMGMPNGEGWQPDDPAYPLGSYHATSNSGQPLHSATPPQEVRNSPAYKIENTIQAARAAGHPFTPEQEAVIRSGGKLRQVTPAVPRLPSEKLQQFIEWKRAFPKEHGGRSPSAAEIAAFGQRTPAATPDVVGPIVAQATAAKQAEANKWTRDPATGNYTNENAVNPVTLTPKQFQDKMDAFGTKANYQLRKTGAQIDLKTGQIVRNGEPTASAPVAQPMAPASATVAPAPATHHFSLGAWQRANPKGNPQLAKQAALKAGYQVSP